MGNRTRRRRVVGSSATLTRRLSLSRPRRRPPFNSLVAGKVAGRLVLENIDNLSTLLSLKLTALAMLVSRSNTLCLALCLLSAATAALADVSIFYPLDDQLPLIARVKQPYNWTVANNTFVSDRNNSLAYTTSELPTWLAFDARTRSFHGTPTADDEGSYTLRLTANDTTDTASSAFLLRVESTPAPTVKHSVLEQFTLSNPALASVYLVSGTSSFRSSAPALRIPPKWSFSIGFRYDTFATPSDENIHYAALQADGSPLPDWIEFNPRSITFNGVTPTKDAVQTPHSLALALHASTEEGYSESSAEFSIFVAEHEVSLATSSLPTINITADSPFSVSLTSPADYSGVMLDGKPIQPSDITTVEVDTSFYGEWLKYDTASRTLSGDPPSDFQNGKHDPVLPVTLVTNINQTLETNVSLAVVPSYFSSSDLQPVLVEAGNTLEFGLVQYFSNATGQDDVTLSAAFNPDNSTQFLSFDPSAATVKGTIPANFADYSHITITFTAYSHVTHSTSHASLPISLTQSDYAHTHNSEPSHLSAATRAKLLLGLKIAFGAIGGIVAMILFFAAVRRCARVPDTALDGEEGTRGWTDDEKKYYGIGIEVDGAPYDGPEGSTPTLRRFLTRPEVRSPTSTVQSPGVMRKAEFLGRIRATARHVSDTVRQVSGSYRRGAAVKGGRPIIGKPKLIMTEDGRRAQATDVMASPNPFDDRYLPSDMTGTSFPNSPSSSTGGKSIPRRRPDFGPPAPLLTTPPQAHVSRVHAYGVPLARHRSNDSAESTGSVQTHAAEAVVHRAERAHSVRSVRSTSAISTHTSQSIPNTRPRIVPFAARARVPVPRTPEEAAPKTKRVVSQVANVFRSVSTERRFSKLNDDGPDKSDDLDVGMGYVRALGDDLGDASPGTYLPLSFSFDEFKADLCASSQEARRLRPSPWQSPRASTSLRGANLPQHPCHAYSRASASSSNSASSWTCPSTRRYH